MIEKQELTVGELVTIIDYSHALRLGPSGCSSNGCIEPGAKQNFKVLVTDCDMPTYMLGDLQRRADTIVMGQEDNVVWLVYSALVKRCQPPHVWKHGDVFETKTGGTVMVHLIINENQPVVYVLDYSGPGQGTVSYCLKDATFLFNIKDKL